MAFIRGANIVTDGLVLSLDAANPRSYPGSGTTWFDRSGNNNSGSLVNGPTFSTNGGGSIVFDGVNDSVQTSYIEQLTDFTVCAFFKDITSTGYARIVDKSFADGFWLGKNGLSTNQYGGGCKQNSNYNYITLTPNEWHFLAMTRNATTLRVYGDGIVNTNTITCGSGAISSKTLNIGATINDGSPGNPAQRDWYTGNIAAVYLYNRTLSAQEVLQNYNAQKSRFNL